MALPQPAGPTIRDRIRGELDFDAKANDLRIAERVLREVTKNDLLPLLVLEVAAVRRTHVRRREAVGINIIRARFRESRPMTSMSSIDRRQALASRISPAERRKVRELFRDNIDLGDGTSATWGDCSVEMLRQRRAMLTKQTKGIESTIERIDVVIEVMLREGVQYARELDV